jgi:membrane fusion protein, adhesin transport system
MSQRAELFDPYATVRRSRSMLYLVIGVLATFLVWSYFAQLNAVVRGMGRVEPQTATQTIQNLEGGIVTEILVNEGDLVAADQLIARMDGTAYLSAFEELRGREALLEMQILRLMAEADPQTAPALVIPDDLIARAPDAARTETALFAARITQFRQTEQVLSEIRDARLAELTLIQPMAARGAVSESDLIVARQAVLEVERQLTEQRTGFHANRMQSLSDLQSELAQIRQQLKVRVAQVERTSLRAPVAGVVNRVVVQTAGGIVAPGDPIVEIIPLDDALIVAGRIAPQDIGPVFVGMGANVKLTAFDYRDYGSLSGIVTHVSADTVTDPAMRDPEPFYEISVALDRQSLTGPKGEVFLRPGMLANVELDAGQRSVFNYLFTPLLRAQEAFSEP